MSRHAMPSADAMGSISSATSCEFLAFMLGKEKYGINRLHVQEVHSYAEPTCRSNMQPSLKGVVNLRGVIVPIIDMCLKFNLPEANYDTFTVIIVLSIGTRLVGMVVDAVSDVIHLTCDQVRLVPTFASSIANDFLLAIGTLAERMLILLDVEKLMANVEMEPASGAMEV